jgi:hypothetical protein
MATSYTSLLGLALPVTGELSGTWGTVVNSSVTQLVEDSVAGVATASVASGDWTLTTTGGGASNEARMAILIPTGSSGTTRNINAPKSSKAYLVVNNSTGSVVVRGGPTSPTTGATILAGANAVVAWNGSDFVNLTPAVSGYLPTTGGTMTGNIVFNSGQPLGTPSSGTLSSCTVDGTNAVGYKNIPQTGSDKTTAYTLVTGDVGKYVGVGTSGSIVVPTSTFANGDAISVYNNTTGNITITTSAPTAYIGGTNTVKTSITLATRGIATILFVSSTVCVVTGNVS